MTWKAVKRSNSITVESLDGVSVICTMVDFNEPTQIRLAGIIADAPTLRSAYIELFSAIENGEVDGKFFKLREKYRNLIQKDKV